MAAFGNFCLKSILDKSEKIKALLFYQFRELKFEILQLLAWKVLKLIIIRIYLCTIYKVLECRIEDISRTNTTPKGIPDNTKVLSQHKLGIMIWDMVH